MGSKTPLAFALTAALAAPAGARTVDSWEVSQAGQSCTMLSTFEDDVSIGLMWSPKSGELGFMAAIPHPNEVTGKAAAIELSFDGDAPLTQWEDDHAAIVGGDRSDAVIANWGAAYADALAKTVRASSHVTVRVGGRAIGTYDLAGSPAAYRELTHCGSRIASR